MQRNTGRPTGVSFTPPVGTAEIRESRDDESEFGLPVGYPHEYCGLSPQPDRVINVANDLRI